MADGREEALVATLGTEPQVVTLVLDELLNRGHRIGRAIVVHTDDSEGPLRDSVFKLKVEADRHYARLSKPVRFEFVTIRDERGNAPKDITTEEEAGAVFSTLYRVVLKEKREGRKVHLSIAGGRKVMSVYGMAVAQLLFDDDDKVWHLVSEDVLHRTRSMHADHGQRVILVPIPVLRWSMISPVATELVRTENPWQALKKYRERRDFENHVQLRYFLEHVLTEAERELLELLVREGLDNRRLARRLHRSEKTVANQLSSIYAKYKEFFGLRSDERVNRGRLISEFAPLFVGKDFP